jgi:hypothetical protein
MERGPPLALISNFYFGMAVLMMAVKLKLVVLNPSEVVAPPHPHLFNPSSLSSPLSGLAWLRHYLEQELRVEFP